MCLYHTVVTTSTNWIGKNAVLFNIIGWGPRAPKNPKHHCGSQQTLCLVPSLGCPTLVGALPTPGLRNSKLSWQSWLIVSSHRHRHSEARGCANAVARSIDPLPCLALALALSLSDCSRALDSLSFCLSKELHVSAHTHTQREETACMLTLGERGGVLSLGVCACAACMHARMYVPGTCK